MTYNNKFTIGADPEYGIIDTESQFAVPPICLTNWYGVKVEENIYKPTHPFFAINGDIKLHQDGAAFELELPPATTPEQLYKSIEDGREMANKVLQPFPNLRLSNLPVLSWDIETFTLENVGDDILEATLFGCDVDYDAFNENNDEPEEQEDAINHVYRYFGGHLHIGLKGKNKILIQENARIFTKMCAVYLGTLCISQSPFTKQEKIRNYRYGKPGRYRIQPHGIEYRSPSNAWTYNLETVKSIFFTVDKLLSSFYDKSKGIQVLDLAETARDAIESVSIKKCKDIYSYAMNL